MKMESKRNQKNEKEDCEDESDWAVPLRRFYVVSSHSSLSLLLVPKKKTIILRSVTSGDCLSLCFRLQVSSLYSPHSILGGHKLVS